MFLSYHVKVTRVVDNYSQPYPNAQYEFGDESSLMGYKSLFVSRIVLRRDTLLEVLCYKVKRDQA